MSDTKTAAELQPGDRVEVATGLSRTGKPKVRTVVEVYTPTTGPRYRVIRWSGRKTGEWVPADAAFPLAR